jgi:hypothetical protein
MRRHRYAADGTVGAGRDSRFSVTDQPELDRQCGYRDRLQGATKPDEWRAIHGCRDTPGKNRDGTVTYEDKNLVDDTTYYYKVAAVNSGGEAASNESNAKTLPYARPADRSGRDRNHRIEKQSV